MSSSTTPGQSQSSNPSSQHQHQHQNSSTSKRYITESQRQIDHLRHCLSLLSTTTISATTTASGLTQRSEHLSTLTSPASETSASLTQASANLNTTIALLRDAREKFDTVSDCEPSIERLYKGAQEILDLSARRDDPSNTYNVPNAVTSDDRSIIEMAQQRKQMMIGAIGSGVIHNPGGIGGGNGTINGGGGADDDTYTATATMTALMPMVELSEQDLYAAADSMEILRDAYIYFQRRPNWKSTPSALGGLERVHSLGVDGMCNLIQSHLTNSGPAIRNRRMINYFNNRDDGSTINTRGDSTIATNTTFGTNTNKKKGAMSHRTETAAETRTRLSDALQNRDLLKSVGEYEEYLPLDTRQVRELRAMYECLTGNGCFLHNPPAPEQIMKRLQKYQGAAAKVTRTEKIGSGFFSRVSKEPLMTGYSHLDAYSEARRNISFQCMQQYYKNLRAERKKEFDLKQGARSQGEHLSTMDDSTDMDASARDAVRCLEHAMVIVAGEKSIYRCVISPTSSHTHDSSKIPIEYKYALVAAYSHVCARVVDRVLDIIELFFIKDAGINNNRSSISRNSGGGLSSSKSSNALTSPESTNGLDDGDSASANDASNVPAVGVAASAAAASLRILDGVRMLGPSLAKLCEIASASTNAHSLLDKNRPTTAATSFGGGSSTVASASTGTTSLASNLCISLHRLTVKNCARALENLAAAVKNNPLSGEKNRPIDARVAAVSSDTVRAVRLVSPFVNAYKSVTKRRPLTWDTSIGNEAGEMEFFIQFLIMSLLANLQSKAKQYLTDSEAPSQLKAYLFMLNNTFYLMEQLGESKDPNAPILRNKVADETEGSDFKIRSAWFVENVRELFEGSLRKYLKHWEALCQHLTRVPQNQLSYTNAEQKVLTLESGRLLKARFNGFNEDFEKMFEMQKELTVIDPKLRRKLLFEIKQVFLLKYVEFFEEYSNYQFSKKNQEEYLRFPPKKLDSMFRNMFKSY